MEAENLQQSLDWHQWAVQSGQGGASSSAPRRCMDDSRSARSSQSRFEVVDEQSFAYLQTAYDRCSAAIRKGKRLGHALREVHDLPCLVSSNVECAEPVVDEDD